MISFKFREKLIKVLNFGHALLARFWFNLITQSCINTVLLNFLVLRSTRKNKKAKKVMVSQTFSSNNNLFAKPSEFGPVIQ